MNFTGEELILLARLDHLGQVMPSFCGTPIARGLVDKGILERKPVEMLGTTVPWETLTEAGWAACKRMRAALDLMAERAIVKPAPLGNLRKLG